MKKRTLTLITILVLLASVLCTGGVFAFAESGAENAFVVVTGSASVQGKADTCVLNGSIEIVANDMATAEQKSSQIFGEVQKAMQAHGTVNDSYFSIYPNCEGKGYTAYRSITLTTEHTDQVCEIREKLVAAGVNRLDGVCFRLKDDSALKTQALQKAVENAKVKAKALGASETMIRLEETSCYPEYRCDNGNGNDNSVTFTACVRAVFAPALQERRERPAPERLPERPVEQPQPTV